MKIGIVCYPTYGGSGVVATEIGMALAHKGHQVHFISYKRPARLISFQENIYHHEVTPVDYPLFEYTPYESALASKIVDVVKYSDLDLLHVHYAIPHAIVAFLARSILRAENIDIPVVTTLHGSDITLVGRDETFSPVVTFSINQSDGVTAVSNHLKEETLNNFDVSNEIKVIYNFIDFNRFHWTNKDHFKKMFAPEDEKILVHISNFRKVKRASDVVKVFKEVHDKMPSKLLMIGDGPERPNIERLCREIGLCHEIRFLGKQDAISEILAISDVFILPSANESFGLAALEAMACKVPIISTNIGGIPEVNIEGETGFLSNVGDIKDMAKNTLKILENPELHETFRNNAYKRAQEFDLNKILPQYESYYEEIIERSKVSI
ncbi:N-acetyl-alpha-D-glucosaminyl L-malate synthase BshA [Membranihabitans maritimus]|uniref:N-acetyl-alpha-D-glucosaminyl L-malate synthase BshA n=1 Tax=Membranihabitans maritimus TaxID=2904244 RepID=UPI001F032BE3|nr:N-acetyl-alpha-D-glucosaminyl L-malate synthase BshA [Membranihabitans maritimus]